MKKYFTETEKRTHLTLINVHRFDVYEYCVGLCQLHPDKFDEADAEAMAKELCRPFIPSAEQMSYALVLIGGETKEHIEKRVISFYRLNQLCDESYAELKEKVCDVFNTYIYKCMGQKCYRLRGEAMTRTTIFVAGEVVSISYRDYFQEFIDWAITLPIVEESDDFIVGKEDIHEVVSNEFQCFASVEYIHKETGKSIWSVKF